MRAIGGQADLAQPVVSQPLAESFDQGQHVPAHERLAASDPDLADTARDKAVADCGQLLIGEQVLLGQKGRLFFHAILAAQITSIRDRQAQVSDPATKGVDQGRLGHGMGIAVQVSAAGVLPLLLRTRVRRKRTRSLHARQLVI